LLLFLSAGTPAMSWFAMQYLEQTLRALRQTGRAEQNQENAKNTKNIQPPSKRIWNCTGR
jgi:hypothetical protein